MTYSNENVRRQDRLLDEESARNLLAKCEYGVLSMVDDEGGAYGLPISFVWDGGEYIYLHCAPVGHKLRSIAQEPRVSFCVVGKTNVLSSKFTTEYESVVIYGQARVGLDEDERMKALRLLINKLSPEHKQLGEKYTRASFHRTEIIKIEMQEFSGKCKKVSKAGGNQAATGNKAD